MLPVYASRCRANRAFRNHLTLWALSFAAFAATGIPISVEAAVPSPIGKTALRLRDASLASMPSLDDLSKARDLIVLSWRAPSPAPVKPAAVATQARQAQARRPTGRTAAIQSAANGLHTDAVYRFTAPSVRLDDFADRKSWSCVPFVRRASAVHLRGDGWMWWQAAEGVYDRGHVPRPGSVLVFKRQGALNRGHVAMVRSIVDSRTIRVDHANWGRGSYKGRIDLDVTVIDISPANDWSLTRVWYTPINAMGTGRYATYGFIYPHRVN